MHHYKLGWNVRRFWIAWLALFCAPALAENWVEYYRTGTGMPPKTVWDLNEVDLDSITRDGKLLRYRVRIKNVASIGNVQQMQADCAAGTHGQLPEPRMYST